jgi:hypothetical protein
MLGGPMAKGKEDYRKNVTVSIQWDILHEYFGNRQYP